MTEPYTLVVHANTNAVLIPGGVSLQDMYALIGCRTVEPVHVNGVDIWVDEEGTFVDTPEMNPIASRLSGHRIFGTAIFRGCDSNGESHALDIGILGAALPGLMANVLPDVETAIAAAESGSLWTHPQKQLGS